MKCAEQSAVFRSAPAATCVSRPHRATWNVHFVSGPLASLNGPPAVVVRMSPRTAPAGRVSPAVPRPASRGNTASQSVTESGNLISVSGIAATVQPATGSPSTWSGVVSGQSRVVSDELRADLVERGRRLQQERPLAEQRQPQTERRLNHRPENLRTSLVAGRGCHWWLELNRAANAASREFSRVMRSCLLFSSLYAARGYLLSVHPVRDPCPG
jgi:hypothetical protein